MRKSLTHCMADFLIEGEAGWGAGNIGRWWGTQDMCPVGGYRASLYIEKCLSGLWIMAALERLMPRGTGGGKACPLHFLGGITGRGLPGGASGKYAPADAGDMTRVWSLSWEDPWEEGVATHSSILAWRIPGAEEPGGLWSTGLQRVGHTWSDWAHTLLGVCGLQWGVLADRASLFTLVWATSVNLGNSLTRL